MIGVESDVGTGTWRAFVVVRRVVSGDRPLDEREARLAAADRWQ